jgi:ATP-binding cassette subfamily E protein 1
MMCVSVPELNVSYKPQKISPKFPGTVRELLHKKVREAYLHPQFDSDVMKPLSIATILDNQGNHTTLQHQLGPFRSLRSLLC